MGVAQALISIFAEEDDKLRSIIRGKERIAFVLKSPLYLFCVSDWGEPEHVVSLSVFSSTGMGDTDTDQIAAPALGVHTPTDPVGGLVDTTPKSVSAQIQL